MSEIKRINLSFCLDREEDRRVYGMLMSLNRNSKTAFVIDAILKAQNREQSVNEQLIKKALREVLLEMEVSSANPRKTNIETEIPDSVFDLFGKL